ncbi:MAG: hypothetical protein G3M78_09200 [Candidatus Nitrohelix vancouverensis]|uniref:Uncharacterized protein n=1 Tax=Candidatus Nitrohelix vancouverensis TaxID=2705534 RepID=A0A7T0C2Z7_9BACT|nr:MAG: hypothetical protein G3M78_09200 [Candidatus Nitrohelix vancouverensis]
MIAVRWFFLLAFALVSCAPFHLSEWIDQKEEASFEEIKASEASFKGKVVVWGGTMVAHGVDAQGNWLEMVQRPLDLNWRPLLNDESSGRFLVYFKSGEIDLKEVREGRLATFAGMVAQGQTRTLGQRAYEYPALDYRDHHFWSPRSNPGFRFHFGLNASF